MSSLPSISAVLLLPLVLAALAPAPRAQDGDGPDPDVVELGRRRRAADQGVAPPQFNADGWEVVAPTKSYGSWTLQWKGDGPPEVLERTVVKAASGGIAAHKGHKHPDYVLRDVLIEPAEGFFPLWGVRAYEIAGWTLERVEIRGMGGKPGKPEGHAFYGNVAGDLSFLGCSFHDNKGQAIQVVARPNAGTAPAVGHMLVRDCVFAENGFDSDRAGFQLSVFGPGPHYDVSILNTRIQALGLEPFTGPEGGEWNSRGGLCIAPVHGRTNLPAWFDEKEPPYTNGKVVIEGLTIEMKRPYQPMALFRGIRELEVHGSTFQGGGMVVIDPPGAAGCDCGYVVWEGNRGDAVLWYHGEKVGPVSGTYVFGTPPPVSEAERARREELGEGEGEGSEVVGEEPKR